MNSDVAAALRTLREGEESARRELVDALVRARTPAAVSVLMVAAQDESWAIRQAALDGLVGCAPASVLPVLESALRDGANAGARNSAMEAYVRLGAPALAPLLRLLRDPDEEIRNFAAVMLGARRDPGALEALVAALGDDDENVRHAAATSLGQIGDRAAVVPLVAVLHREPWLQYPAVHALGEIGDPSAAPALVPLLADELLRPAVLDALARLANRDALPALVDFLHASDALVRNAAVRAVVAIEQRATASGETLDPDVQAVLRRDDLVDHLLAMLVDDDDANRRTAAITLGWLKEPRAEPALIERLGDPALHEYATHALVSIGCRSPEAYQAGLDHPVEAVRQGSLRCLAFVAPPGGLELVAPLIHDPSPAVRAEAVAALGRLGRDEDAAMLLFELLADESEVVQESAMDALAHLPPAGVRPLLVQALERADPQRRVRAVETLGRLGDPAAAAALEAAAADPRESVRRAAIKALGELELPGALERLRVALSDPSGLVRQQAVLSLGRLQDPEAAADLLPLLDNPDPRLRFFVLQALGRLRHPGAAPAVLTFLNDERPELRFAAVEALGGLRAPAAVRPLLGVLQDADRNLRRAAAESLGHVGDPQAVPALLVALEDEHWSVRCAAAAALGRLASPKAVVALLRRLDDDDATVRRAVLVALGEIGDPRATARVLAALEDPALQASALETLRQLGPAALTELERAFGRASEEVRRLLVGLLGRSDDRRARRLLRLALADTAAAVRAEAAFALGDGGDLDALRPLMDLKASDPAGEVRQAATRALRKLAPRGAGSGPAPSWH
jgi:HEAT repeat protein